MPKTWFSDRDVSVLEVKHFNYAIDGHAPINTARIDNPEIIQKIIHQIEQLPADGPEFRSFMPKELLELNFVAKESKQVVSIYDGHFKTPSTGFNTSSEAKESEALIYNEILSLFEAKENKALFQIKGPKSLTLRFVLGRG